MIVFLLIFNLSQSDLFLISQVMCYDAALGHFIQQFQQALGNCNDENDHIPQTLEELERLYSQVRTEKTLWASHIPP